VRVALVKQVVERNPFDVPEALTAQRFESMAREVGVHDAQASGNAELEAKLDEIPHGAAGAGARVRPLGARAGADRAPGEHFHRRGPRSTSGFADVVRSAPRERDRLADLYRHPEARREIAERWRRRRRSLGSSNTRRFGGPSNQT
jgi:hypothetical protein